MIQKDTIIRLVVLIIILINQILCSTGTLNFEVEEEQIYEIVSLVATIGMSLWAMWKNNSFTIEAIMADEYLKELKAKK